MRLRLFVYSFVAALLMAAPVLAADPEAGQINQPMTVIDSITLQGSGVRVTLWGLKPAQETVVQAEAIDFLEKLISGGAVSCRVASGSGADVVARCAAPTKEDIGLELLSHGFALADRRQAVASVPAYLEGEKSARQSGEGLWHVLADSKAGNAPPVSQLLLNMLPIAAVLALAVIVHFRMKRLEMIQIEAQEHTERKEGQLLSRERHVLASTLEGELTENKNRIEAFITIYGAMLDNLKNTSETPKYQKGGDIVQKHPLLSKTVFEGNVGKFSLLDMKLAAQLSKLYAAMPKEQEYINIQPSEPLPSVIALVEKVLHEAAGMVPPITAAIHALDEIMAVNRNFDA